MLCYKLTKWDSDNQHCYNIYVVSSRSFPTFRRGIYNCRRHLTIQYIIAIHLMRWLNNFILFSSSNEQLQQQLEYTLLKPDCHSWWISKIKSAREDTLEERYAIKFYLKLGKMPQKPMECFRLLFDHLASIKHQFLSGIRDSWEAGCLWGKMRGVGGVGKLIHQSWLAKELGLDYYVEVLTEFRKRFCRKRPTLFKLGQWYFKLDNAPVNNSILFTDYLPKMGIKTLSVTLGYSLSSEAVVIRQLRRWKRLWERPLTPSHKRTSMEPSRSC